MTQFAADAFSGAPGTELSAYDPNWVRHPASAASNNGVITSDGRARNNSNSNVIYTRAENPASADYSVSCDVFEMSNSDATAAGVIARASQSDATYYYARYIDAVVDAVELYKCVVGTFTQLGSSVNDEIITGTIANIKINVSGTTIQAFKRSEATPVISVTDASISAAGKVGIRLGYGGTGGITTTETTGYHIDNFSADQAGGAVSLSGSAPSQSAATGALTTSIPLAGAALGASSTNGALSTSIPFAGAATVTSGATGALNTSITLLGAAIAQALAAAGLSTGIGLGGGAAGQSSAVGDLTIQIRLAGNALAQALATGDLTAPTAGLSGAAIAQAAVAGALTTQIPLTGAALVTSSGTGGLSTIIPLAGVASSVSSMVGSLDTTFTLSGDAIAQALAGGDLTAKITFDGAAVAQAAASGALSAASAAPTPVERTLRIAAENRTLRIAAENRTLRVAS